MKHADDLLLLDDVGVQQVVGTPDILETGALRPQKRDSARISPQGGSGGGLVKESGKGEVADHHDHLSHHQKPLNKIQFH